MVNRKTGKQTVETILKAIEGKDFKTVNQISEITGLSYETVERWIEIIELIKNYLGADPEWERETHVFEITQVGKFKGYRIEVNYR